MPDFPAITRLLRVFGRDRSGGLTVAFGLAMGGMVVAAGAAIDYSNASSQRYRLQAIADAAAMAGAREFRLGNASEQVIRDSVANHARAALGDQAASVQIGSAANVTEKSAKATLSTSVSTYVMHLAGARTTSISVTATAKMTGGAPVCVIGLEENENGTVEMEKTARLNAPNCAVYSNSKMPAGLVSKNSANLTANFICSAGGMEAAGPGSFSPAPRTDCPIIPDPLRTRPMPSPGGCTATNMVVNGTVLSLNPGTYCGGLTIEDKSIVTFHPGVYIFKDGPLHLKNGGRLSGVNVSLFFSGGGAIMKFEENTTVSLTARRAAPWRESWLPRTATTR